MDDAGELLLNAVHAALRAVDGELRVREYLTQHPIDRPVVVIAMGKAACAMAHGALTVLGERVTGGLVVSKQECRPAPPALQWVIGGHPVADETSLAAGRALLRVLERAPPEAALLFLISGGTSALVEVLPAGIGLDELTQVQTWLQASGWDIAAVNAVRSRLSCIKAGRLARYLGGRPTWNLLISDVPGDDPAIIGSGPLIAADPAPPPGVPDRVQHILGRVRAPPPPRPGDPCLATIRTAVIAGPADAAEAAAAALRARGQPVQVHRERLTGDVQEAARRIAATLISGAAGAHIWSGETTITLPDDPGRGGRNQSLCLAVAQLIAGAVPIAFTSIGTDGNDGATDDAGAVVDQSTVAHGREQGLDAGDFLRRADAAVYLEAVGALVHTGLTGTNVSDLMIGWRASA